MDSQLGFRQKLLIAAVGALALVTVLPMSDFNYWLVRIWDFPRPQLLGLALLLSLAVFVFDKPTRRLTPVLSAVLLCILLIQTNRILPYTPVGALEVQRTDRKASERNITILGANVLMTNREPDALKKQIEEVKPDLLLLTECDQWWLDSLHSVIQDYPYRVEEPIGNTYGMALYSRFQLVEPEIKYLLEDDIPSIHTKLVLPSGELLKLYCVHPRPPAPQESDSTAQRDAELILLAKESSKINDLPIIVIGDLNDVAWSPTTRHFQAQSGLLDPRKGRGFYNTFHASYPFARWPLDHLFHDPEFRLISMARMADINSDHFPIMFSLALTSTEEANSTPEDSDPDERDEVREIVEDEKEADREAIGTDWEKED